MNSANRTETPIARATVTRTAATKRGARARKLRLNREPSAQPSNNCAPLSNTRGIAEVLTPAIVSGIVIKSAPKTKALGTFRRVSSRPTARRQRQQRRQSRQSNFAACGEKSIGSMQTQRREHRRNGNHHEQDSNRL